MAAKVHARRCEASWAVPTSARPSDEARQVAAPASGTLQRQSSAKASSSVPVATWRECGCVWQPSHPGGGPPVNPATVPTRSVDLWQPTRPDGDPPVIPATVPTWSVDLWQPTRSDGGPPVNPATVPTRSVALCHPTRPGAVPRSTPPQFPHGVWICGMTGASQPASRAGRGRAGGRTPQRSGCERGQVASTQHPADVPGRPGMCDSRPGRKPCSPRARNRSEIRRSGSG